MKKSVIFDVDGTICDNVHVVLEAWKPMLEGKPHAEWNEEFIRDHMGKTMDAWAADMFPSLPLEQAQELVNHGGDLENKYILENGTYIYPGIEEVFQTLSQKMSVYILSNCGLGYIEAITKHAHIDQYVEGHLCFGDTGLDKPENIKLLMQQQGIDEAVYIGDTQQDYNSTMKAGILFIFASYGFGTVEETVPTVTTPIEIIEAVDTVFRTMKK